MSIEEQAAQVDRVKGEWIASIRQEKAQPSGVALRVLPALMYGAGHPYGNPLSGTGTEAAIAALTRDDLVAFHQRMMQPAGATLVVVGDTTLAEIVPLLEKHLGSWKVGSAGGAPAIPAVANARQSRVFLIDQPGAVQANIFAAQLVPSSKDPGAIAFDMANQVFGGDFTARLNMNLREDKHWSYGARSGAASAVGGTGAPAEGPDPEPARRLRDRRLGAGHHRQQRAVRPPGRLRVQAQGGDRGDHPGPGRCRGEDPGSGRDHLGGGRRPGQDRGPDPRPEAG